MCVTSVTWPVVVWNGTVSVYTKGDNMVVDLPRYFFKSIFKITFSRKSLKLL